MPYGIPFGDPQHEMMAEHYKSIVIDAMRQFDNSFSNEIYEALSWVGLMGDGLINPLTGLPPNPTVAWQKVPQQQRLNILNAYNTFKNDNPHCE